MSECPQYWQHRRNGVRVARHFFAFEFECPCCGGVILRPKLLALLDELRDDTGPMRITSGYRCEAKNWSVYDEKRRDNPSIKVNYESPHRGGWAVDVASVFPLEAEARLRQIGFVGVGFARNFTHLDVKPREGVSFRSWTYQNGKPIRRRVAKEGT